MSGYTIISPVRNEEEYIERTIESVIRQTMKPLEWIIVNDGSTDRTAEIIERYLKDHPWIKLVNKEDRGYYFPGTGVVDTFYRGFENIRDDSWEYVVKLDCDLSFDQDYFKGVISEFQKNPKLGIASGLPLIPKNGQMVEEKVQDDHPVGPSKIYRRKCFEDIGGLKPIPGWDLADLLSAQMNDWETRCFPEYKLDHYRITGSRRKGITKGKFLLGRFEYRFGYSLAYVLLKAIYRLFDAPILIGSIGLVGGYLYAFLIREKRLYDKDMRKFLRKRHRKYLIDKFTRIFRAN